MWRTTIKRIATAHTHRTIAASTSSSSIATLTASPCPYHPPCINHRSFHSTPLCHVSGSRRSPRVRVDPAELRLRSLRAAVSAESALDAAAADEAAQGGAYRRPHIKRTGRAVQERREELERADAADAEALEARRLDEMEAKLSPAEKQRLQEMMDAEGSQNEDSDASSGNSSPLNRRDSAAHRAMAAVSEVVSPSAASEPSASLPADLVSHVHDQLRRLDNATHSGRIGGGGGSGIGFDTINLSRSLIGEDEVFEVAEPTAGMRKLLEGAKRGDTAKKMQLQRIERVTDRTKELIARVLLEESIRIGQSQSSGSSTATHRNQTITQLIDLRTTPSFRIHQVRYSTDLAWASIMWTLGKDGYDATVDPELAPSQPHPQPQKRNKSSSASLTPAKPNWFVTRRRISSTLDHVLKPLRFVLGRDLDLKYTPSIKFTYDDLHDARMEQEQLNRQREQEDEEHLQQMLSELHPPQPDVGDDSSGGDAKAALRRQAHPANSFNTGRFNTPEERAADAAADAEYDANTHYFLPKRKIAALVEREKRKMKIWEAKKKKKLLLQQARAAAHGVSAKSIPAPAPETTDPTILRAYLQSEMARIVRSKDAGSKENIALLMANRAAITQLQQVQSLARKAVQNPVEDLKEKRHQAERPQYPKEWKKMKQQYWKKTDGRTRSKH